MPAKEDVRVEVDNEDMETETTVQPNNAVPDTGSAQENAAQPTDDIVPVQDWFNPSNPSNPADALPTAAQHIQTKNQEKRRLKPQHSNQSEQTNRGPQRQLR
jgi:Ni,Fe-hydrogenase III small subunit